MKITKFVHSCLLIEVDGKKVLIDPGEFTWDSGALTDELLTGMDYCVITHEHFDHFHVPAVQKLQELSPDVIFKAGPAVVKKLQEIGLTANSNDDEVVQLEVGEHAHLWEGVPVIENVKATIAGKLLHVGDSMDATSSPAILALPIYGPWLHGTVSDAVNLLGQLKPQYFIPIHDWHYNTKAREDFIARLQDWLEPKGTKVIGAELGKSYDVQV